MDAKLAMKIYNVMSKVKPVAKDMTVGEGTKSEYKAVGEATVLNQLRDLFLEEKLIMLPSGGEINEYVNKAENYQKITTRCITQLKVKFLLVDAETGESVDIIGFGNGADSQDKGSGKAFTYAYKTALMKTFMMVSGEDTDNTHSDEYNGNDAKVTTAQLAEMLGDSVQATIDHYNEKTGSSITELKYMKQEWKKKYYDKAKERKQ